MLFWPCCWYPNATCRESKNPLIKGWKTIANHCSFFFKIPSIVKSMLLNAGQKSFYLPFMYITNISQHIFVGIFWATLDLVFMEEGKMMNPADLEAENIQAFIANIAFCIGGNTPNSSFYQSALNIHLNIISCNSTTSH